MESSCSSMQRELLDRSTWTTRSSSRTFTTPHSPRHDQPTATVRETGPGSHSESPSWHSPSSRYAQRGTGEQRRDVSHKGMTMKKIINEPAAFVDETIDGILAAHPCPPLIAV